MENNTPHIDFIAKLEKNLAEVREELIAYEKKNDGYLVISDKDGKVIKVPAKDL